MAKLAAKPAYVIVNAAPPRGAQAVEARKAVAEQYGVETCPVVVAQRAVYGHAVTVSQAAQEFESEGKAAEEIAALWKWLVSVVAPGAAEKPRQSHKSA